MVESCFDKNTKSDTSVAPPPLLPMYRDCLASVFVFDGFHRRTQASHAIALNVSAVGHNVCNTTVPSLIAMSRYKVSISAALSGYSLGDFLIGNFRLFPSPGSQPRTKKREDF